MQIGKCVTSETLSFLHIINVFGSIIHTFLPFIQFSLLNSCSSRFLSREYIE